MDEDIAGLRRTLGAPSLTTCSECGQVFEASAARLDSTGLRAQSRSEFAELCPDCDRLEREGEAPVIGSPEA